MKSKSSCKYKEVDCTDPARSVGIPWWECLILKPFSGGMPVPESSIQVSIYKTVFSFVTDWIRPGAYPNEASFSGALSPTRWQYQSQV
jgi:hypothetical protein